MMSQTDAQQHPGAASPPAGEPARAIAGRLDQVRRRMAEAAERAGRSPHAVTLVVVSKGFPAEVVAAARVAGQSDFAESTAQELRHKTAALGPGIRWHFVGRLQRNKVRDVVGLAGLVHSVEREEQAELIAERARRQGRVQRVLVQVNVGRDERKGGCEPERAEQLVGRVRALDGIACQGLMTVPPMVGDPRPVFRRLRDLRDRVRQRYPEVGHLSMGMSADFETAVEEGSTIVRLGEAVLGPRDG